MERVLRPGGHFLYTDFRGKDEFAEWDEALANSPLRMVSERVINPEVLRGLEGNSPRSLDLVGRRLPAFMRPFGRLFAGVPGSLMYRELERGGDLVPDVLLHQGRSSTTVTIERQRTARRGRHGHGDC